MSFGWRSRSFKFPIYINRLHTARPFTKLYNIEFDLVTFRHGVVISGREMIYEAFVKQSLVFASRPFSITNMILNPGRKGRGFFY